MLRYLTFDYWIVNYLILNRTYLLLASGKRSGIISDDNTQDTCMHHNY